MNIDFPSSRAKFRESFGYDFPYDSDEELEVIDRKYQDESGRFPSIQSSGNGSSGACSTGIYVLQEELRVPLSEENLADLEGSVKARGRRISDAPSYKSEETRSSEGTRGREGDLMDKFLGTLDSSGKTGTSLGTGTSSTADPLGKSNADSTFFLGALDQSSANVSNYRESIKVPLRDSTSGDGYAYAPRFSNYTAAEKSTAESTFFFGCIDDEMASRMSRERIIIPTKLLPQGLDIGQEMQDDKSVRSALTCDKSYVLDGLFSEGDDEDESKHGDKRGGQRGPMRPEESDESDRHETRSRSGSSMAKSTGSSHHGSFMGWGDPYGNDSESDSDHDEEKQEDKGNVDESGREGCGNVVCDFPMNRAAFHSSFRSTNSSASVANSIVTAKSSETSGTSSSGRRASRRSSMNKNNRRRSMRGSLETINSSTSFNKSLRGSMRASLSESIERRNSLQRQPSKRSSLQRQESRRNSFQRQESRRNSLQRQSSEGSLQPRRKSLTELLDASTSALPLVGWDDQSDSSSLISSSERKVDVSTKSQKSHLSASLSLGQMDGGFFCDEWVSRASFRKVNDTSRDKTFRDAGLPIAEEFDSKKPWMKGPAPVTITKPVDRRGSSVTLSSSINSLDEFEKSDATLTLPTKHMRSSFTSATSSLGDDQSISSDLTELRQAQEALFSVPEDQSEEETKEQELLTLFGDDQEETRWSVHLRQMAGHKNQTEDNKAAKRAPSPQLSSVLEEEPEPDSPQLEPSTQLAPVEEESDEDLTHSLIGGLNKSPTLKDSLSLKSSLSLKCSLSLKGSLTLSMASTEQKNSPLLDDLEVDVDTSDKGFRSPAENVNEDDSDTYSDCDNDPERSTAPQSLGVYMNVNDADIEKEFNTIEMENIDFKECRKEQEDDNDLDMFLESSRGINNNFGDDVMSHKTGKSSSKRSGGGWSGKKLISDKLKPIKDRVKKKSGSNHVRRRHKRLWKFCVWNCKKITIMIVLLLVILAGIGISSWYGASKSIGEHENEESVGDEVVGDELTSPNVQWPPVGETGRNPMKDKNSTSSPSPETTTGVAETNSSSLTVMPNQSSTGMNPSISLSIPSFQPSILGSQDKTPSPSVGSVTSSTQTPVNSSLQYLTVAPSISSSPFISIDNNNTSQIPTQSNFTFLSPTVPPSASSAPAMLIDFNKSSTPSPSPFSNSTLMPSGVNTSSLSPSIASNSSGMPTLLYNTTLFQSTQIIAGEADFQYAGSSVGITPDGQYLAVGFKEANGNDVDAGLVRVYAREGTLFVSLGVDSMFGSSPEDEFGSAVALSHDGRRVAVGARSSSTAKDKNGEVIVYEFSESTSSWQQLGNSMKGLEDLERFGYAVDMSGDGMRMAVGSPKGNGGTGSVSVYEFNRGDWELVGDRLVGNADRDKAGFAVSMSTNGKIVAVGAFSASLNGLTECGSVTVYSFDDASTTWVSVGQVMAGTSDSAQFGYSLALSGDGRRIVVGSNGYSLSNGSNEGSCEIFELDSATTRWTRIGAVYGEAENEEAGYHVSMAENGEWIACSKTTSGNSEGAVVLAREVEDEWKVCDTLTTYENSPSFGSSTSISQDGEDVVVGAPLFNGTTGYVELFNREG